MTVASTSRTAWSVANGSVKVFSFTFVCLDEDHLEVYFRDLSGIETEQTTGFVITINGDGVGGNITFTTAPTNLYLVGIVREVPETQETDYVENSDFRADTIETDLDKLVQIDQQQTEILGRTLKVPISDTGTSVEIPNETDRASKFLAFDVNSNPIASEGTTTIPYTAFTATLLDDLSALAARATLGLTIGTDVQAYDAQLAVLASYTGFVADEMLLSTDSTTLSGIPTKTYGRSLLNTETAAGARSTLGAVNSSEDNTWSESQLYTDNSLTCTSGTTAWDMNTYQNTYLLLDQDTTLSGIVPASNSGYYTLLIENGNTHTLSFDSAFLTSDAEEFENTTTSGSYDLLGVFIHNGLLFTTISTNFS